MGSKIIARNIYYKCSTADLSLNYERALSLIIYLLNSLLYFACNLLFHVLNILDKQSYKT